MAFDGNQKSINLIGENEIGINMKSPPNYKPKIIEDGCRVCILSLIMHTYWIRFPLIIYDFHFDFADKWQWVA